MDYATWLDRLTGVMPVIATLFGFAILLGLALWLLRKLYGFVRLLRQETVFLELTPPSRTDRNPKATSQLFAALYGLGLSHRWYEQLFGYSEVFSLEIVSTRKTGIRFAMRVASDKADALQQSITTYVSDVKIKVVEDYLNDTHKGKPSRITKFKQAKHFAYPLQEHEILENHDPIGYLTAAMTKLADDELMSFQVVIKPMRNREAEALRGKILHNEDLLAKLDKKSTGSSTIFTGINTVLFGMLDTVSGAYHGPSKVQYQAAQKDLEYQKQIAKNIKPVRTLSYFEHELVESIHRKLGQPLFHTELRLLVSTSAKQELKKRRKSIEAALGLFSMPKYQSLKIKRVHFVTAQAFRHFVFARRLPGVFHSSNILSASELSSLYHFPNTQTAKTENVVKSLSRTLPAPVSLKNGMELDILLGKNIHHGSETPIGLTAAERERHIYMIGGTGNGKTTMLLYSIVQDIQNGKGVAIVDPHGDLAETILRYIPEDRLKDVIYFKPRDIGYPIGLNLLELPDGLDHEELLLEQDFVTEAIVSVFRKTFSENDSGGHRIEYILRNAIRTAFTVKEATLFTLYDLLTDSNYRKTITNDLEDKRLKNFWKEEFGKAGSMQRVKMGSGVTTKLGRFDGSAVVRRVMEQPRSTIDFDDILNSGKILICNFAKGALGEDTSELFGISVLAKLQLAALRRARQPQADRRPFYLYVDEFQNFATMSFVQMLSEARKYKLFLTMAEQSTSQQDQQRMVDIILANVGTVICFRSGSPADERLILPLFLPYIQQGEIANLPAYNFYARIAAIQAQEPMSGETVLLDNDGDPDMVERVINSSRKLYASEYAKAEPERVEHQISQTKLETKQSLNEGEQQPLEV